MRSLAALCRAKRSRALQTKPRIPPLDSKDKDRFLLCNATPCGHLLCDAGHCFAEHSKPNQSKPRNYRIPSSWSLSCIANRILLSTEFVVCFTTHSSSINVSFKIIFSVIVDKTSVLAAPIASPPIIAIMRMSSSEGAVDCLHLGGHLGGLFALCNPLFDATRILSSRDRMQQMSARRHPFVKPKYRSLSKSYGDQFLKRSLKQPDCD